RRAHEDRRRDAAHARLQPAARGKVAPAGGRRARARRGERAPAPARLAEGRLPQPGEPRGAHAHDLHPLVLRDPARDAQPEPERVARYVDIIHEESVRLTRLLDSTLDLSLLERGEAPLDLAPIDPEAALEASLRTCHGLASKSGVRLESGGRARGARVLGNVDRLSQVFINLVSNAIKYNTSPSPRVRVSSRVREGTYEVLVE